MQISNIFSIKLILIHNEGILQNKKPNVYNLCKIKIIEMQSTEIDELDSIKIKTSMYYKSQLMESKTIHRMRKNICKEYPLIRQQK
jgi:hypothetical protein